MRRLAFILALASTAAGAWAGVRPLPFVLSAPSPVQIEAASVWDLGTCGVLADGASNYARPEGHSIAPSGRYDFCFDKFNRLVGADYTPATGESADADFSTEYSYDVVANPLKLKRYGIVDVGADGSESFGLLDELKYSYGGGNRVAKIARRGEGLDYYGRPGFPCVEAAQYSWNKAGALTADPSRGIDRISYNARGLTDTIAFADGTLQIWRHSSDSLLLGVTTVDPGGKLRHASVRQYRGNRIFVDRGLEYSAFEGGYFDAQGAAHYYHTDYRGNIVMVTDSTGAVTQRASYYPYGEPHRLPEGQPYLFAAKERHPRTGATLFGPRNLLTAALLWTAPDPHAANYHSLSPWTYCAANPVNFIDPTGKDIYIFDHQGHLTLSIEDLEKDVLQVQIEDIVLDSEEFEYGTISKMGTHRDFKNREFLMFKVKGSENAARAFEFLADHILSEFSILKCGVPGPHTSQNFITTSYQYRYDIGAQQLIYGQLQFGYYIHEFTHSHPSRNDYISPADKQMISNIGLFINNKPNFFLYVPNPLTGGVYFKFDQNTTPKKHFTQNISK